MDDPATPKAGPGYSWRLVPMAVAAAVLTVLAAAATIAWLVADSDEPGPASNGLTLNTSSWSPDDENAYWMQASIGGTVRVDTNGCVYLEGVRPDAVRNVIWPAGYTAFRQSDGTVTISNPDGVVIAATGYRIRAGGGYPLHPPRLACSVEGGDSGVMLTDVLPPLEPESLQTRTQSARPER